MPWGAAIAGAAAIGGSVLSSNAQKKAAKKAANATGDAADASSQALADNYAKTETNLQPYADAGRNALVGINAVNHGDYSGFLNSPDYQAALTQGIQAQDRSAAAKGSLYSGGHSADLAAYAGNLASQNFGNYYNRLAGLAQLGQSSATSLGSIGTGNAAQQGNFNLAGANAAGEGAYANANANSSLYSSLAGVAGQLAGQYGTPSPTSSSYGTPGAQSNAGLLGGGNYTGPGSTSTSWGTNPYSALGKY